MARILGIDFGERRLGLAMSDPTETIAQPLKTLSVTSHKRVLTEIKNLIEEFQISKIVVGLPLTMSGKDSENTRQARAFARKLEEMIDLPVILLDERLTTIQAHQVVHQMGKKPSQHKARVDQLAAQYILQTYLDREKKRSSHE
ncbi:MAG: Holliday junction resolvase RuvX [Calditrichia bacterium]